MLRQTVREMCRVYGEAAGHRKVRIFSVFLRLKHRVNCLHKVHRQSMAFMAHIPGERKNELLTFEQQRQREVAAKREREGENWQLQKKTVLTEKLFKKCFNRLRNDETIEAAQGLLHFEISNHSFFIFSIWM